MPACILTVDDEETVRTALELLLRDHGYEVSSAATAAEAEAMLARHWFDLVFLDLRLPDSDGIALLEHIKRTAPETEVVLMTAHGSLEVTIDAIKTRRFLLPRKAVRPRANSAAGGKSLAVQGDQSREPDAQNDPRVVGTR
jgi:DNA-binding NtrC family response regulator